MKEKVSVGLLLVAAALLALVGCSKRNCEEVCECAHDLLLDRDDAVAIDVSQCIEDCRDNYKDDSGCRESIRDWAKCIRTDGCDENECDDEWNDSMKCHLY